MVRQDRHVLGQYKTLYEPGVDFDRLRRERLEKVQREMAARDIGALVLADIQNIRYTTGVAVMPIWTAYNLAHYVLVPVEGEPTLFEAIRAEFRAEPFFDDVRAPHIWQARFAAHKAPQRSMAWAAEIKEVLERRGLAETRVGVDILDYHGFQALNHAGLTLCDADEAVEAARTIKTPDEIELLHLSASVCESALFDMEQAIRPGITENELMGVFWHGLLALGGEYMSTRLLVSGTKTNPWFHEAGSKRVRPGDLVAIDTDATGPEGYLCDISRTFLCGDEGTPAQKEAYRVAHDFVLGASEELKPGMSFEDYAKSIPEVPEAYREQWMPAVLHGIGTDNVPPFVPILGHTDFQMPEGQFEENMVVAVECYAGRIGAQDGVKLEDEIWITTDGPVKICHYPYERKLLE